MQSENPVNAKKNPFNILTVFNFNLKIKPINKIKCNLEFVSIVTIKTSMYEYEFAVANTTL